MASYMIDACCTLRIEDTYMSLIYAGNMTRRAPVSVRRRNRDEWLYKDWDDHDNELIWRVVMDEELKGKLESSYQEYILEKVVAG